MKLLYSENEKPTSIEQHRPETNSSIDLEAKKLIETIWRGISEGLPNVEAANLRKRKGEIH